MTQPLQELVELLEDEVYTPHLGRLDSMLSVLTAGDEVVYCHVLIPRSEESRKVRTLQLALATEDTWVLGTVACGTPRGASADDFEADLSLLPLLATKVHPIAVAARGLETLEESTRGGRIDFEVQLPDGRLVTLGRSTEAAGTGRRISAGEPFDVVRLLRSRW